MAVWQDLYGNFFHGYYKQRPPLCYSHDKYCPKNSLFLHKRLFFFHFRGLDQCKSVAFLAQDLVSVSWICFLTDVRSSSDHRQLACLRSTHPPIASDVPGNKRMDDASSSVPCPTSNSTVGLRFDRLTYLPAIDAVYVPDRRMTACLERGTGVVLYTGVRKVTLLSSV